MYENFGDSYQFVYLWPATTAACCSPNELFFRYLVFLFRIHANRRERFSSSAFSFFLCPSLLSSIKFTCGKDIHQILVERGAFSCWSCECCELFATSVHRLLSIFGGGV